MKISELAVKSATPLDTIRYYEKRGLIREVDRTEAGYRIYSEEEVLRLRFIRSAKTLGFSLAEVSDLLAISESHASHSHAPKKALEQKRKDISEKIVKLKKMNDALKHLNERCDGTHAIGDCPILNSLWSEDLPH